MDFIGQANKKYNFEEKFAALLSHSNHSMQYEVKKGFVSLPKGCYIQLEKKASEVILANIRRSFGDRAGLISRIETFTQDSGLPLSLKNSPSPVSVQMQASLMILSNLPKAF